MVLEHKFCVKIEIFDIMLFVEVQPDRGNLFTFPCLFAPNEFQFAPNETKFAQNETHYAVMRQMKFNLHQMKLNLHQMKFHFHKIFYRLIGATLIGNFFYDLFLE